MTNSASLQGMTPMVSLVVATLGRTRELSALLDSLCRQTDQRFEVLLMDQNPPGYLDDIVTLYAPRLNLKLLRVDRKGACSARNRGAQLAVGEWVMFPDDDCTYPPQMLERLASGIAAGNVDFYGGRAADPEGRSVMSRYNPAPSQIGIGNVWTTSIEWMAAIRRDLFLKVGGFDERLGPGSGTPFGAYEINDLVLALIEAGATGRYDPDWTGHHDFNADELGTASSIAKMHHYARGMGYVLRKHRLGLSQIYKVTHRALFGAVYFLLTGNFGRARRSRAILSGIACGWWMAGGIIV